MYVLCVGACRCEACSCVVFVGVGFVCGGGGVLGWGVRGVCMWEHVRDAPTPPLVDKWENVENHVVCLTCPLYAKNFLLFGPASIYQSPKNNAKRQTIWP